jgi:hypothetical protein
LGLERFEANSEVISNAADRQMSHVRNVGRQHERVQAVVLGRLSTARVCLLDPAKRQQYDRMLRETSLIELAKKFDRPPMPGPTKLDPGAASAESRPPKPGPVRLDPKTIPGSDFTGPIIAVIVCIILAACLMQVFFEASLEIAPDDTQPTPGGITSERSTWRRDQPDDPQPSPSLPATLPGGAAYEQATEDILETYEQEAQKAREDFNAEMRRHNLGAEWEITEQQMDKVINDVKDEVRRLRRNTDP